MPYPPTHELELPADPAWATLDRAAMLLRGMKGRVDEGKSLFPSEGKSLSSTPFGLYTSEGESLSSTPFGLYPW
jgi:hypothetical protein